METEGTFVAGGEVTGLGIQRRFRDGERLLGYTRQGIPIVMDDYAVDPLWGTREEALAKRQGIRAEMARILSLPRKEQHPAWNALGNNFRTFSEQQASYLALARVYTRDAIEFPGKSDDCGSFRIWLDEFRNAKAARARKRMVKRLSQEILLERRSANPSKNLVIASIACGSAMPVLEAVKALGDQGIIVKARLLDFSGKALKFARGYAQELGLDGRVETVKGNVFKLDGILGDNVADEGELVGLLDYPNDWVSILVLRKMWRIVKEGGKVICSNIMHNDEDQEDTFLHAAINWEHMYRRDESHLAALFLMTGFLPENLLVHVDPYRTFCLVEAVKTGKTNLWGSIHTLLER